MRRSEQFRWRHKAALWPREGRPLFRPVSPCVRFFEQNRGCVLGFRWEDERVAFAGNHAEALRTETENLNISGRTIGSRSPVRPRRLRDSDTHKRIAVPKAFCVLREHPRPRPKSGKVCRSDTRPRRVSETCGTLRG